MSLAVWLSAAVVVGLFNAMDQPGRPPTLVGAFVALPIAYFVVLYRVNASFRRYANTLSLPLITAVHTWRYVGLGFIAAYYLGYLPAGFGIPEGVGDVVAAVFAIPLARAIYAGRPVRRWFVLWNVFGLIDLVSAITVGILYSPSTLGLLRDGGVSTALIVTFPISLIPTFLVPLFILLHLLSLVRSGSVARE